MTQHGSLVGRTFGRLTVVNEAPRHAGPSGKKLRMEECECECGARRVVHRGNLLSGKSTSCGCLAIEAARASKRASRSEELTYSSAHSRVRRDRGPAGSETCPCGVPAAEWAYDHADPDEQREPDPRSGAPRFHSADPTHYVALCRPCHRDFDELIAEVRSAPVSREDIP